MSSNTLAAVGIATIVVIVILAALRRFCFNWQANRRASKISALEAELERLCRDISNLPTPRLTTEHIPQRFPSKVEAEEFGKSWSRGGVAAYRAKAIDNNNFDEDHPKFDKTSIAGGCLYTYPALFFGMKEAHRDDDDWSVDFMIAKNRWLKDYLADMRGKSIGY